jgi:hypothetical protein
MNKLMTGLAALASASLLGSAAHAATPAIFESNYGSLIVSGDDTTSAGALPFAFTLFDQTFTGYEASNNGFISFSGANGSGCCNGDVGAFLSGGARIAPEWFDIVGGVYLNTDTAGRAVFTWSGSEYSAGGAYDIQAQLFQNGTIIFGFNGDSAPWRHATLTGITLGGGLADPGEVTFAGAFSTGGSRAVYDYAAAGEFGLNGQNVIFTPDGNGGYHVSNTLQAGVPEPATWAMMITGFGLMGATLRRRRMVTAAA